MEENNSKRGQLKVIVLLLIGFIIGFATHAFTVSEESVMPNDKNDTNKEELIDTDDTDSNVDKNNDKEKILPTDESTDDTVTNDKEEENDDKTEKTSLDATPNNSSNGEYLFSVVDQSAGGVVYVSSFTFPKESWIAVREDNDGVMGNILGAHRYPIGEHTGAVELLRNTQAGQTYYVVIYIDDGDKDFDHKKDTLLIDNEGNATAAIFRTY